MHYSSLRAANVARQAEWDTGGDIDLSYAGNELAGEAGELIEAVIDLIECGTDDTVAVCEEMGDVIICCDLIANRIDRPLMTEIAIDFGGKQAGEQIKDSLLDLAIEVGGVSNTIKKRERERFGMVGARGSLDDLARNLQQIVLIVYSIGDALGLSARGSVAAKFNATSAKYGLKTKMDTP